MPGLGATMGAAVALVLSWSGAVKLRQPLATRRLLHRLGLPSHVLVARLIGVGEFALAAAALIVGGRVVAVLLAAVFASFAVVSMRQASSGAESCGCFGDRSAPPGWVQVVTNLGCVVAGAAWALQGGETIWIQPQAPALSVFALLLARIIVALHNELASVTAATSALRRRATA